VEREYKCIVDIEEVPLQQWKRLIGLFASI